MRFTPENTDYIFRAIDSFCDLRYAFMAKQLGEKAILQHLSNRTLPNCPVTSSDQKYTQTQSAFMISAKELFGEIAGGYALDTVNHHTLEVRQGNRFDEHGASYLTARLIPDGMELQKHFARYAMETARINDITTADAETMLASATKLLDVIPTLQRQSAI